MFATALLAVTLACSVNTPGVTAAAAFVQGRQETAQTREARDAMKKLSWLAGRWHGTATVTQGPGGNVMEVDQSEDVRFKVFDTVLLIEGTGRQAGQGDKPGEVIFEALAVVSFDAATKKYVMRALSGQGSVDPQIEVMDKELIWSFEVPGGQVKYHIKLDGQGQWVETGEFSRDEGATWMKFIDLKLKRQDDPAP